MREKGFRAVGGLAQRLTVGLAKGRNASIARLQAQWSTVVGPELARMSRPEALVAGRGRAGKLLRLRVPGAAALEIQHRAAQLVERVNGFYGHHMVDDIRIVQGPISTTPPPPPRPAPDPRKLGEMTARAATVEDPALRAVLARLGARVASRRQVLVGGLAGGLLAMTRPRDGHAQDLLNARLLGVQPNDHLLGKPDAPNILIDYASFTCPFCAQFYIAVLPVLRREWIDTGKLLVVHRHFPMDMVATRASQLTECGPRDRFFDRADRLFRNQVEWLSQGDPLVEMVRVLAPEGVTQEQAEACFVDDRALDKVLADIQSGQGLGVRSTPALFINDQAYSNPGGADAIAAILRQVGR